MRKRFTLSLIALIASAFLFVMTSFAWFMLSLNSFIGDFGGNVSGILYDLGGEFIAGSVIYPELNVIESDISITNQASTNLYLRMKIEYTKVDVTYDSLNYTYTISSPVLKNFENIQENEHLKTTINGSFFYETDGYWYLDTQLEDSVPISLISSISYDGFKVSNEYINLDIIIMITIEVTYDEEGIWSPLTTMVYTGAM